jgi:transporter family-2 protein
MGLIIVGVIGYSVPRLGLVVTFTIMVSMQFLVGALLDHFGLVGAAVRPLDLSRLLGMAILMLGTWLTIR